METQLKRNNKSKTSLFLGRGYRSRYAKEYDAWNHARKRCTDDASLFYAHYGGRGIGMCHRWLDVEWGFYCFIVDMGKCPSGMELDRMDNNGNYSPDNCRWTTKEVNGQNRRTTVLDKCEVIDIRRFSNMGMSTKEIASLYGLKYDTAHSIIKGDRWKNLPTCVELR